jgi:acetylornithine deacetylase
MAFSASVGGEGGHSSRADTLPRPLAQLARVATSLDDWGRAHASSGPPGFPGMCMNVAELRGGVAFNVVPASAELIWSVRPPPGTPLEEVRTAMAAIVPADIAWKTVLENPSFETRDTGAFRELFGARLDQPEDLGFWTEAALLSQSGIDAVVWGPGDIAVAHAPDEFVPLVDLAAATLTFGDILSGPV